MLTILEKELNDNYMQLYYNDEVFKYNYIITDEWWHKTWLPNSHKRLTIEVFINQLYAMSLKYNNPPIISFSIGLYPVKISEGMTFIPNQVCKAENGEYLYIKNSLGRFKRSKRNN